MQKKFKMNGFCERTSADITGREQDTVMVHRGELLTNRIRKFKEEVTVYPVSCERLSAGRSDDQWLDQVLLGGARIVQLRDKDSSDGQLLEKARMFRRKTSEAGALFIVNDRLDIALLSDADGIHLGQNDIPPGEVVQLAPEMIIGLSCNTEEQAKELGMMEQKGTLPVAYYNIGPIYPTKTKEGLADFLGPAAITRFSAHPKRYMDYGLEGELFWGAGRRGFKSIYQNIERGKFCGDYYGKTEMIILVFMIFCDKSPQIILQ